ncbi:MAG: P27 family phage terminase small subunit [Pirellulales bacterium]
MNTRTINTPPEHLAAAGSRFWAAVVSEYDLEPHAAEVLRAACEQLDRASAARAIIDAEGLTTVDRFGQVKPHPAVGIEKEAHLAFMRLRRELNVDTPPAESRGTRPAYYTARK